jgi:hypothetical protein
MEKSHKLNVGILLCGGFGCFNDIKKITEATLDSIRIHIIINNVGGRLQHKNNVKKFCI